MKGELIGEAISFSSRVLKAIVHFSATDASQKNNATTEYHQNPTGDTGHPGQSAADSYWEEPSVKKTRCDDAAR